MNGTEIVPVSSKEGRISPEELQDRVRDMQEVMRSLMRPEVHYGIIPGCKKPSLWKPGAEMLAVTFGIAVDITVVDFTVTPDEVSYRVRATGKRRDGAFLGAAEGECSTSEKKYRWRAPVHRNEFDGYPEHLKRITWNARGDEVRQVRQEPGDLRNTVLQMASKRAMVQMIRGACAASDIFMPDPADDRSESDEPGPVVRTASGDRAAAAGPAPALRVVGMQSRDGTSKKGEPYTMFTVTLSDGRTAKTFKAEIGAEAEQAYRVGFAVKVQVSPGRDEGEWRLDSIERADAA